MEIYFSKHAEEKFSVLARHGIKVSRNKVLKTVLSPDIRDYSRTPLVIAQSELDKMRVLRVVYKKVNNLIMVITFYPGRKTQYEK